MAYEVLRAELLNLAPDKIHRRTFRVAREYFSTRKTAARRQALEEDCPAFYLLEEVVQLGAGGIRLDGIRAFDIGFLAAAVALTSFHRRTSLRQELRRLKDAPTLVAFLDSYNKQEDMDEASLMRSNLKRDYQPLYAPSRALRILAKQAKIDDLESEAMVAGALGPGFTFKQLFDQAGLEGIPIIALLDNESDIDR